MPVAISTPPGCPTLFLLFKDACGMQRGGPGTTREATSSSRCPKSNCTLAPPTPNALPAIMTPFALRAMVMGDGQWWTVGDGGRWAMVDDGRWWTVRDGGRWWVIRRGGVLPPALPPAPPSLRAVRRTAVVATGKTPPLRHDRIAGVDLSACPRRKRRRHPFRTLPDTETAIE